MNTNPRNESNDWGRKHHVDGWRGLDGSLPTHQPVARKMPKRRHGARNEWKAGDPLIEHPAVLIGLTIIFGGILLWQAGVFA